MAFPSCPTDSGDSSNNSLHIWLKQVAHVAVGVLSGKTNNVGTVTLTPSSTSTTLIDPRLTINSFIKFDPLTANALADNPWSSTANRANGQFIITHANTSSTDKTYRYLIVG